MDPSLLLIEFLNACYFLDQQDQTVYQQRPVMQPALQTPDFYEGIRPVTEQLNACYFLEEVDEIPFEQHTPLMLPRGFYGRVDLGVARIAGTFLAMANVGLYRVANPAGFAIWVSSTGLPDLSQPATHFTTTLPYSIPVTPPVSGTTTYYIITRLQDQYGLVSQNQRAETITINSAGMQVLPAVPEPQSPRLLPKPGGVLRAMAVYPTFTTDQYPANEWQITITGTSGSRVYTMPVTSPSLAYDASGFAADDYTLDVILKRVVDSAQSTTAETTATYPAPPVDPGNVHNPAVGY